MEPALSSYRLVINGLHRLTERRLLASACQMNRTTFVPKSYWNKSRKNSKTYLIVLESARWLTAWTGIGRTGSFVINENGRLSAKSSLVSTLVCVRVECCRLPPPFFLNSLVYRRFTSSSSMLPWFIHYLRFLLAILATPTQPPSCALTSDGHIFFKCRLFKKNSISLFSHLTHYSINTWNSKFWMNQFYKKILWRR